MEKKNQNTLFIGDDESDSDQNDQDKKDDMYEDIFNEIKENFKDIDEKDKIKEEELAKKQSEEEKEKEETSDNKESAGLGDFVVVDKEGDEIKRNVRCQSVQASRTSLAKNLRRRTSGL